MSGRHAEVRRVLPVARILRDVVEPHRPFAVERRGEHAPSRADWETSRTLPAARPTACTACSASPDFGSVHVVEERAEFRVCQFGRDVGDLLDDRLAVERRRDDRADLAQLLGVRRVLARRALAAATRSVMSRAIFEAPTISPRSFRIGETVSEIDSRVPSLRCRIVS